MGPITEVFPVPQIVPCGGFSIKVAELRLRDLVSLQAVLDSLTPDPLEAAQKALGSPDRAVRHAALLEAYDLAERGPAGYGEDSGRAYFSTPEGGGMFLWVAGRRWKSNEMTPAKAGEMFARSTTAEYSRVWRICHGVSARRALGRMLLPFAGDGPKSAVRSWGEMVDDLSSSRGWTYDQILNLSLTQWIRARNDGQIPEPEQAIPAGEAGALIIKKQLAFLAGEIDEDGKPVIGAGSGSDASSTPGQQPTPPRVVPIPG